MILYHFTSTTHLADIVQDEYLATTESNVSRSRPHAGPDVVWLTSNPDPGAHIGWGGGSIVNKRAVQFTVDVPKAEVHRWRNWGARRGIDPKWMRGLAAAGGSNSWWVVERPVPASEWEVVIHLPTRQELWPYNSAPDLIPPPRPTFLREAQHRHDEAGLNAVRWARR
jgi:hypothetical protein